MYLCGFVQVVAKNLLLRNYTNNPYIDVIQVCTSEK